MNAAAGAVAFVFAAPRVSLPRLAEDDSDKTACKWCSYAREKVAVSTEESESRALPPRKQRQAVIGWRRQDSHSRPPGRHQPHSAAIWPSLRPRQG